MKTIVCITARPIWEDALQSEKYTRSTITSNLEEVDFIHATTAYQTMEIMPLLQGL